jgi:transposase
VSYTWIRAGERRRIPYENPQGRRLNVLAALAVDGPHAALYWVPFPGTFRADHIIRLCEELPPVPVPTVVVLDNASIHVSTQVKAARPALRARRTFLYYLPPYSPELNDIERLFRTIKYDDLPERRYPSIPLLDAAVRQAFTTAEERLLAKHGLFTQPQHQPQHQPRLAA